MHNAVGHGTNGGDDDRLCVEDDHLLGDEVGSETAAQNGSARLARLVRDERRGSRRSRPKGTRCRERSRGKGRWGKGQREAEWG